MKSRNTGSTRQYAVRGRKRAPYRVREQKRRLPVVVAMAILVVVVVGDSSGGGSGDVVYLYVNGIYIEGKIRQKDGMVVGGGTQPRESVDRGVNRRDEGDEREMEGEKGGGRERGREREQEGEESAEGGRKMKRRGGGAKG